MSEPTFEQESAKVEEAIATKLIPEINNMLKTKNVNAKVTGGSTDENFVYVNLLVDQIDSPNIVRVEVTLDKTILYSRGCCAALDTLGGYRDKNREWSLDVLVLVRILRVVFMTIKAVAKNAVNAGKSNIVKFAFNGKDGTLFCF